MNSRENFDTDISDRNLLESIYILEGLQQAEYMKYVCGLQSKEISDSVRIIRFHGGFLGLSTKSPAILNVLTVHFPCLGQVVFFIQTIASPGPVIIIPTVKIWFTVTFGFS